MTTIYEKIGQLHEKYKDSPKTIDKLNTYIHKHLPQLLENYNQKEKKNLYLEKESERYINEFLTDPNLQFFYISTTDTFIKYTGQNYDIINEDEVWYTILNDITQKNTLIEWKQKIKNTIIKNIKNNSITNTIPDSHTVQQIIRFFTPTLLNSKIDVKHFLTILGDNILGKQKHIINLTSPESKNFFSTLDQYCQCYFKSTINICDNIKFTYRNYDYNSCRIIYFTKSIINNFWFHFLKNNIFNIIAVSCHYSNRFKNADHYLSTSKNIIFKKKILYRKNFTDEVIIDTFIEKMITKKDTSQMTIHFREIYLLWKIYLEINNLPTIMCKSSFEQIIKNKINYANNYFTGIESKYLSDIKIFQKFWTNNIIDDDDDEIEISELFNLLKKNHNVDFSEEDFSNMIKYFYTDIIIENDKIIKNIKCQLWDKQRDVSNFFTEYNWDIDYSNKNISLINAYKLYCTYTTTNNLLTVSKNYFHRYIDRIIPQQYISNNNISKDYWSLASSSS
jgi:hypothetical protein